MQTRVFDVDDLTFERDVLERSRKVPVVVDFWAAWCGPCRQLGPLLERLAEEADGAWVLAKVDVDRNPASARAVNVQGIPAVHAFKDGRHVAQFVGALPEPQVRRWLAQLGPSPGEVMVAQGRRAEADGDLDAAARAYRRALETEPGHAEARAALERVELLRRAGEIDGVALRRRLAADPGDVDAAISLSDHLMVAGDAEGAFDALLTAIAVTAGDRRDAARAHLLRLLDTIPAADPRAMGARRRLAATLF